MKNNYLVIFFIGVIFSIIIYKEVPNNKKEILILGDNYLFNSKYNTYDTYFNNDKYNINKLFLEDNITYKQILNNINNNHSIYLKNEQIYLNQQISKADYIIINANNIDYEVKCNKGEKIIENYNNYLEEEITLLINKINKISHANVIIIGNYCSNLINYLDYGVNVGKVISLKNNIDFYSKNKLSQDGNYNIFNLVYDKM